jgi:glycerophosphoryl diester phosphodiesterase
VKYKRRPIVAVAIVAILAAVAATQGLATTKDEGNGNGAKAGPIVIGHRGASGYRPEHTLGSYQLAIDLGADYIEPDLVSTKDHVLVARHENDITGTTDVASHPEFASRKKTKVIDGVTITGWFTEDFTLAELKTLRAVERLPDLRPTNTAFNGLYEIPTFDEVIKLAKRNGVGIYPETKHPSYFDSIGLSLEEPLIATLHANGWDNAKAPVLIQSFEVGNLKQLNGMTSNKLVQLIDATGKPFDFVLSGDPRTYADLATRAGLQEIAKYADGVGPNKNLIVPRDAANRLLPPTSFVHDAHAAGLVIHPWTFRRENTFLPEDFRQGNPANPFYQAAVGNLPGELELFYKLGVDGVFSDNPDVAVSVRTSTFGDRGRR